MGTCLVERYRIYTVVMGIVMLKESMRSAIEYFNLLVSAARCQACAIWMEFNVVYHSCVICEGMDLSSTMLDVPDSYSSIITT